MTTPKILQSYRFAATDDRLAAEKAIWCDIPTSILILGPNASGKTRLARDIAESNGMDPFFIHSLNDQKSLEVAFSSSNCVILDNLRDVPNGGWPFPSCFNRPDHVFDQRKLGTRKSRRVVWSGLLIVTTSELSALDHLEPGSFDLVIGLLRPVTKKSSKKSRSPRSSTSADPIPWH